MKMGVIRGDNGAVITQSWLSVVSQPFLTITTKQVLT